MLEDTVQDETELTTVHPDLIKSDSDALMDMLDIRSANLGAPDGHSDRVALYAVEIGRQFDFSDKDLITLRRAAVLHDIGKIGISSQIVDKLGRLTDREFEIMRLHTTIAIRMLERIAELKDALPMIKHHHERFDGKGYPDGLSGHDIPLGARIIAVAETFDMLVSDIPWRNAMSLDEAEKEIRVNSGTQFDPVIAEMFLTALKDQKVKLPSELTQQLSLAHEKHSN